MEDHTMVKKKTSFPETESVTEPLTLEETTSATNVRANLEEIKTYDGVIGFILRNSTSAAIDLKDPTKIIDYAILSSSALEASEKLCELFDLGEAQHINVEGKDVKVLSLIINENRISIFMEKNADCEKILRKLHSF
jgi:predicted regulator of Ras-like GTPase activity (Roadblock/LC7/MglB family)